MDYTVRFLSVFRGLPGLVGGGRGWRRRQRSASRRATALQGFLAVVSYRGPFSPAYSDVALDDDGDADSQTAPMSTKLEIGTPV